jgi:8-oxo-dGTP pyrophosphatase MutT (NUDIX family)
MDVIKCSGALFYAQSTKRFLFLQKAEGKHSRVWGIVGGTNHSEETAWEGLKREIVEELGSLPKISKTIPLETFVSNDEQFHFYTYLCIVKEEFIPILSNEHVGWAWSAIDSAPKPLHSGLKNTLANKVNRLKLETVFEMIDLLDQPL